MRPISGEPKALTTHNGEKTKILLLDVKRVKKTRRQTLQKMKQTYVCQFCETLLSSLIMILFHLIQVIIIIRIIMKQYQIIISNCICQVPLRTTTKKNHESPNHHSSTTTPPREMEVCTDRRTEIICLFNRTGIFTSSNHTHTSQITNTSKQNTTYAKTTNIFFSPKIVFPVLPVLCTMAIKLRHAGIVDPSGFSLIYQYQLTKTC